MPVGAGPDSVFPRSGGRYLFRRSVARIAGARRHAGWGTDSPAPVALTRQDVADLTGRLAALARAGVPARRAWEVLATSSGSPARVAARVVEMVAVGGSVSDGVQVAAAHELAATRGRSPAGEALQWLSMTQHVVERAGAPSAAVHDGISAGLLAELAQADDQAAALAGPRTTAVVLGALPLAGTVLGATMGADVPGTLIGTPAGRVCLLLGIVFWLTGGYWARRLVGAAAGSAGRGP